MQDLTAMGPEGFEPPTGSFEGFCSVP